MSPSPRQDASGVLVGMVPVPGRGWSSGSAEVADSCRRHRQPDWALDQDAVGVPAALRWQTAAGGIGSRKGKGPTKWEGPPAAVCHLSATKQQQQSSRNKAPKGGLLRLLVAEGGGARKRLAGLSRPVLFRQAAHKRSLPVYRGRFDFRLLRRTIIIRTVFSLRIFRIAMPQSSLIRKLFLAGS